MISLRLVEFNLGHVELSRELHGANVAFLLRMRLHEESVSHCLLYQAFLTDLLDEQTYANLDPLDADTQLRAWWQTYCADRSAACFEDAHTLIAEDFCSALRLPAAV